MCDLNLLVVLLFINFWLYFLIAGKDLFLYSKLEGLLLFFDQVSTE